MAKTSSPWGKPQVIATPPWFHFAYLLKFRCWLALVEYILRMFFIKKSSARDDGELAAVAGEYHLPEEKPRESTETWHSSPQLSRHIWSKGAAPLIGADEEATH
jgi:hypothetical protein